MMNKLNVILITVLLFIAMPLMALSFELTDIPPDENPAFYLSDNFTGNLFVFGERHSHIPLSDSGSAISPMDLFFEDQADLVVMNRSVHRPESSDNRYFASPARLNPSRNNKIRFEPKALPEPSALFILGIGMIGIAGLTKKIRNT